MKRHGYFHSNIDVAFVEVDAWITSIFATQGLKQTVVCSFQTGSRCVSQHEPMRFRSPSDVVMSTGRRKGSPLSISKEAMGYGAPSIAGYCR